MRKSIHLALLCLLPLLLGACATGVPTRPDDVCQVFKQKRSWHREAMAAQKKWGTPLHIPMAIMHQESGFRHKARPPRKYLLGVIPWRRPSSAFGYAQVIDATWRHYLTNTGSQGRRSNFSDSTDFIHWYINQASSRNGIARTDTYNLYLNYHEGPAGFARGTHLNKPWLTKVAKKVEGQANVYRQQYAACKESLKGGFWRRLLL